MSGITVRRPRHRRCLRPHARRPRPTSARPAMIRCRSPRLCTAFSPARHLEAWARARNLSVRWREGDRWAAIEGPAATVGGAFGVAVRNYRSRQGLEPGPGVLCLATATSDPAERAPEVAGLGRVLGYLPYRESRPPTPPRDVPDGGLLESTGTRLQRNAADRRQLHRNGITVVVFAFDGFDQQDMDSFADLFDLPRFTPEVVGGMPEQRSGRRATMDLQVVRDRARCQTCARQCPPQRRGRRRFPEAGPAVGLGRSPIPRAIWSFSIGWGRPAVHPADLARSAPHLPTRCATGPPRSTPPVTSRAWNAKAGTAGRIRQARMMSAWMRWPPPGNDLGGRRPAVHRRRGRVAGRASLV